MSEKTGKKESLVIVNLERGRPPSQGSQTCLPPPSVRHGETNGKHSLSDECSRVQGDAGSGLKDFCPYVECRGKGKSERCSGLSPISVAARVSVGEKLDRQHEEEVHGG